MTTGPGQSVRAREGSAFSGTSREAFFARISAALDQPRGRPSAPPDTSAARVTQPAEDLGAVFAQRAHDAGMFVHHASCAEVVPKIANLLTTLHARSVVVSQMPNDAELREVLASRGLRILPLDAGAEPHFATDVGISGVLAAVAETGSLVCASGSNRPRATSLIPPVHVAVVLRSQIVPDLLDFFRQAATAAFRDSSGVVLITGPSKTADIEGILITGVHGPREVHVFIIGDA